AAHSAIPVINMLSPSHHPCQALADLLTLREAYGSLAGVRVAYIGDGNNVARSLAVLGTLAGIDVAVASPPGYALEADLRLPAGARGALSMHSAPQEAVQGARAVYTDVWVSMGGGARAEEGGAGGDGGRGRGGRADAGRPAGGAGVRARRRRGPPPAGG